MPLLALSTPIALFPRNCPSPCGSQPPQIVSICLAAFFIATPLEPFVEGAHDVSGGRPEIRRGKSEVTAVTTVGRPLPTYLPKCAKIAARFYFVPLPTPPTPRPAPPRPAAPRPTHTPTPPHPRTQSRTPHPRPHNPMLHGCSLDWISGLLHFTPSSEAAGPAQDTHLQSYCNSPAIEAAMLLAHF